MAAERGRGPGARPEAGREGGAGRGGGTRGAGSSRGRALGAGPAQAASPRRLRELRACSGKDLGTGRPVAKIRAGRVGVRGCKTCGKRRKPGGAQKGC